MLLVTAAFFGHDLDFLIVCVECALGVRSEYCVVFRIVLAREAARCITYLGRRIMRVLRTFRFGNFLIFKGREFFFVFLFCRGVLLSCRSERLFYEIGGLFCVCVRCSDCFSRYYRVKLKDVDAPFEGNYEIFTWGFHGPFADFLLFCGGCFCSVRIIRSMVFVTLGTGVVGDLLGVDGSCSGSFLGVSLALVYVGSARHCRRVS